jgi:Trp operon repressor
MGPESNIIIMVVKNKCSCKATKAIIPEFLLGERGIGSRKTMQIIELLVEGNLLQKKIAKVVEVSEATVTRVKQRFSSIKSTVIISEILKTCKDYPTSKLKKKTELTDDREKIKYNISLLKKLKTVKGNFSTKSEIINNMNYVQYYNCYRTNQKFITLGKNQKNRK